MARFAKRMLVLGLAFVLLAIPAAAAPPGRPFVGSWWSIDQPDGSFQTLHIGGGANGRPFQIQYRDYGASVCGTDEAGEPLYAGIGKGQGWAEGNVLTMEMRFTCLSRPAYVWGYGDGEFAYDAATDRLVDKWGIVWQRMGTR